MSGGSRKARRFCFDVGGTAAAIKSEMVFVVGEPSIKMYFAESGDLCYLRDTTYQDESMGVTRIKTQSSILGGGGLTIGRGDHLSEAALWSKWTHVGDLLANND